MAEYIELEAAIGALRRRLGPNTSPAQKNMLQLAAIDIRGIKTADVAPVRHGRWVDSKHKIFSNTYDYVCSNCGCDYALAKYNYCPNCGAKMDGKEAAHADDHD